MDRLWGLHAQDNRAPRRLSTAPRRWKARREGAPARTVGEVSLSRRHVAYFALRGLAAAGVLVSATVVPRGLPAALLCMASGLLAVLTCIGVNAGGPGERAGTAPQARAYERIRPPQGAWPPYDPERVVDGELVERER